jgi:glycosyltransferase involved in cell wall biosynthesis
MRILQICSARDIGGGERHVADLANRLAEHGHEVFAAVSPSSPLISELRALPKENVFEVRLGGPAAYRGVGRLAGILRDRRIDVIHAHLARDYPIAAMAAGPGGTPFVLTRHVLFPMKRVNRLVLRRAARVIAVSNAVAEELRKRNIFSGEKIVVIHNGVDVRRFADRGVRRSGDRLVIGMIGQILPIKGQTDFVKAAADIVKEHNDVEFVIAGEDRSSDGRNLDELKDLIANLKLSDSVKLLGWQSDIAATLRSFDVYVSPSRFDAFGIAIVEAMASGVPVVATTSAGTLEIIDDGETGLLVPVGDVEKLATAIKQLLNDPALGRRLAEKALDGVQGRFSLNRMVEATEKVYEEALK